VNCKMISLIILASALLTACATTQEPPPNRGRSGMRLDPTHDAYSELGSRAPRSPDLVAATDQMAQDIASRLDITDRESPPHIVVGIIENHSSFPQQNYQAFLVRLRAELQSSGARHGLHFIRERQAMETYRQREYGTKDPSRTAAAYQSDADYMLTCELYDLPSGGTNYFLFDYQLIQLIENAESGPNIGVGAIVWENMYEVKYQ